MPLTLQPLPLPDADLPPAVDRFLQEAERRTRDVVEAGQTDENFIPCDGITMYHAMTVVRDMDKLQGARFCEWGSGMGTVIGLAAMLGWKASGIEIQPALVGASRQLLQDYGLPGTVHHGSYDPDQFPGLPKGIQLHTFNLVFAYTWPSEEDNLMSVFETHAASGAQLLLYRGIEDVVLYRKP